MRKLLLGSFITLCLFNFPAFANQLDIPGTGDGVGVLKSVAEAFQKETGVNVRIPNSIGSGGGVVAAGTDKVELARVARGIKEKEQHFGLTYQKVFEVPTVFFVSKDVSVDELTSKQILDVFSGKVDNWSVLGGESLPVLVIVREKKDSSYNNLKKTFPGFKELVFGGKARVAIKTPYMVNIVLHESGAIGFGPLDVALANGLKILNIDGKKPTDSNYPYHGNIGLVYKPQNLKENSKKFLGFITSEKAKPVIEKAGGIVR